MTTGAERRKKFRELKEQQGGIFGMRRKANDLEYRLFFTEAGDIITLTKDPDIKIQDHWVTHDFSQDQLKILKDAEHTGRFVVVKDPNIDNLYSIEVRKTETVVLNADNRFLSELVVDEEQTEFEVLCTHQGNNFQIALNNYIREEYRDVAPENASRNNRKVLYFYFTAHNDPHVLFEEIEINICDLLLEGTVNITLTDDLTGCSIYTKKIFDTYKLLVKTI
jgi:hypothetical protein